VLCFWFAPASNGEKIKKGKRREGKGGGGEQDPGKDGLVSPLVDVHVKGPPGEKKGKGGGGKRGGGRPPLSTLKPSRPFFSVTVLARASQPGKKKRKRGGGGEGEEAG